MIHSHLERVGNYRMKIGSILNFQERTRTTNSSATNLRKAEIFISICSKIISQILTVFYRFYVNFILCKMFFQIIITDVFDDGESINNAFFTIEKFFFYQNHIISDRMILFSYAITGYVKILFQGVTP